MKLKITSKNFYFHPFELAFCGFSNTGKTTLVEKIIQSLSQKYDIGYFKHDAHHFSIDHPGKDTYKMQQAGALTTLINDDKHFAKICHQELDQVTLINHFVSSDILLIEGHKFSKLPKYFLLNTEREYEESIRLIRLGEISNIAGIISNSDEDPFDGKYPFFNRNDIDSILLSLESYLKKKIPSKINALILTGGYSKRMLEDKATIQYFGVDQVQHTINLVKPFCEKVFISCRSDQENRSFAQEYDLIFDQFPSVGPTSGILSAQFSDQESAWMIIACDLPYLDSQTIQNLVEKRNPFKVATCYLNPKRNWPEPLCTIYEPKSYQKLMEYFALNKPCPRKVLFNSNIEKLCLQNELALNNVNTPQEKMEVFQYFEAKGNNYAN